MPAPVEREGAPPFAVKVRVLVRSWLLLAKVGLDLRRHGLPEAVRRMEDTPVTGKPYGLAPVRLGRMIRRIVRLGPWRPRCLMLSMILFRVLKEQGHQPELVVGLPAHARDKDAHAWVELNGADVGPPPGRGTHVELARYG
jgi:hypothetical protein